MGHRANFLCALCMLVFVGVGANAAEPGCQDAEKLTANKQLVQNFFRDVMNEHHVDDAGKYLSANYLSHNKNVGHGVDGFEQSLRDWLQKMPDFKTEMTHIAAEGDYVWVENRITLTGPDGKVHNGKGYDILRIENGKIAEHWDSDPD